jgi:hypothetical protein
LKANRILKDEIKDMSYLPKFLKVPYTLDVLISILGWAVLCVSFGFFLILSRADFEKTGTRMIFVSTFFIYVAIGALLVGIEYGLPRFFGVKERRKELRVLNDNIENGHLLPGISTETLKEVFSSLSERPGDWIRAAEFGSLIVLSALLTELLAAGETTNIFIILVSGTIAVLLLVMFAGFFAERFIFPVLKECRGILMERGEKIEEPRSWFNSIRTKFLFFLLVPIVVVMTILSFMAVFSAEIVVFSLIGLGMAVMISNLLSFSIYKAFSGIRDFARSLPRGEKTLFSTGSLDMEILDLSESLNDAAGEVYKAKVNAEDSRIALQERVGELERFHRLTVGRELRMVELKERIEKLEKENKKLRSVQKINNS